MNNNEVDKFLLSKKFEIADNGFSEQVMQQLPARRVNRIAVERLWTIVCLLSTLLICSQMEWLGPLLIDIKAFIVTLPLENGAIQWFYILGLPILLFWASMALLTRFAINKITQL